MYQCFFLTYFLWETLGVCCLTWYVKKNVNMIFGEKCFLIVMKYFGGKSCQATYPQGISLLCRTVGRLITSYEMDTNRATANPFLQLLKSCRMCWNAPMEDLVHLIDAKKGRNKQANNVKTLKIWAWLRWNLLTWAWVRRFLTTYHCSMEVLYMLSPPALQATN